MEQADYLVFTQLYREAYLQCFKQPLAQPISETESKIFYNEVLEQTGLAVGWRSLKNYSFYVLDEGNGKQENPSVATLDTIARYVLKAPYTNEIARKSDESHHPYWFLYRKRCLEKQGVKKYGKKKFPIFAAVIGAFIIAALIFFILYKHRAPVSFSDNFEKLGQPDLQKAGWRVMNLAEDYWARRNTFPDALTLFTLPGDNWPDSAAAPSISNLLIRKLPEDCFSTEMQMQDFIPAAEWQQAGILLMADSNLNSPSIRISLAFNDFFGGNDLPPEVIVQAISSPGNDGKPEELIHYKVLTPDSAAKRPVLFGNLKHTALRIEKQGKHFRFLYAGGLTVNDAFKELATADLILEPRYVAIFALKGRIANTPIVPVHIKKFIVRPINCR